MRVACRLVAFSVALAIAVTASATERADDAMQRIDGFEIDRSEVSVAAFARFADATRYRSVAEREGGGHVYGQGWERRAGWTWRRPFGELAHPNEPAVHITFADAQAYCRWAGKRLPTDREWVRAAYVESRDAPPAPWTRGRTYRYPTGDTPEGARCLGDCGDHGAGRRTLDRGIGPAQVGTTRAGVNGLWDMGGNVWEWVDAGRDGERVTRGGSWWYGAAQMQADQVASKPAHFAAVYVGFRCVRDRR